VDRSRTLLACLARIGIVAIAVVAATALQWPTNAEMPGNPFLFYFVVVVVTATALGRRPGFFAVAATSIASMLRTAVFIQGELCDRLACHRDLRGNGRSKR
jgi:hypothetical protein